MKLRSFVLVIVAMLIASNAMAQGFYAGGGLGFTKIEDSEDGESFNDMPIGWKLFAGYDFNDNFGVEGGYINSGKGKDTIDSLEIEAELSAFVISGIGYLPMNEQLDLFGKAGYYNGESEVSALGITLDDDEDGFTLGAGLRYDFGNNLKIRGDFDWYESDLDSLWSIGVGLQYYFGN